MKRFILTITTIFMAIGAYAETETINWYMDDNTYATTQCETGSDIILPQTPYKYGYTFNGWTSYTPIEYLESTGKQWLKTDVALCTGYTVEAKYKINEAGVRSNGWNGIYGSGSPQFQFTQNPYDKYTVLGYSNKGDSGWTDLVYPQHTNIKPDTEIHTVRQENNKYYMDGQLFYTMPEINVTCGKKANLFGRNVNDQTNNCQLYGRIYYVKFWQDSVLVRDFIPVLDKDGTPCMFDKVEGKFYYNAGTGDFIAGPVIGE